MKVNLIKILMSRIDALEQLLVCYRVGKNPTEKLHTRLDKTKKALLANSLEIIKAGGD